MRIKKIQKKIMYTNKLSNIIIEKNMYITSKKSTYIHKVLAKDQALEKMVPAANLILHLSTKNNDDVQVK